MLFKVLRIAVTRFYDNIGKCIGYNLIWFAVSGMWLALALYATSLVGARDSGESPVPMLLAIAGLTAVLGYPATGALYWYFHEIMTFGYPSLRDFLSAYFRLYLKMLALGVLSMAFVVCLIAAMAIYAGPMRQSVGRIAPLLAIVLGWVLFYFLAIQMYIPAFIVHQNCSVWTALKRSALLFMMKPVYTIVLFAVNLLVFASNLYLRFIPLVLFEISAAVVLANVSVLVPLEEYEE